MKQLITITSALSDETRLRALLLLRDGELCVCQVIDTLGLSPSNISRHMTLLYQAGLVERRKEGKWHYYRLASDDAPAIVKDALAWVLSNTKNDPAALQDSAQACCVKSKPLAEACACYRN